MTIRDEQAGDEDEIGQIITAAFANHPHSNQKDGHSAHPPVIIREFPAVPSPGRGSLDAMGHRRPCAARLCRGN